jgi:hypothetical protein
MTELMCYRKNRLIPIIEALADIMKGHYSKVNFSYSMRVFDRITMNTTAEGDPRITIFLEAVKEERDQYATAFDRFLMKLDGMTYQTEQQNDGEQEPNS